MSLSAVGICSNALQLLGDSPIASFATSEGKRAVTCANLWPQVRDFILRRHVWSCTRARIVLAPEATEPPFDWGYSFLLPADCMRLIQVGQRGVTIEHEVTGRRVLADTTVLYLVYQQRVEDPSQWDAAMTDAAVAEMAARLAYPITQSASMAELKRREADAAMKLAKAISGQDNPPEDWGDSPFIDVRG